MDSQKVGNFLITEAKDPSEAMRQAYDKAVSTDSEIIPVTMYRQGDRYQVVGAMPFRNVARMLYSESARKGASLEAIVHATNRPKDPAHIVEIADYVKTNLRAKYVFGALTLNASQELEVIIVGGVSDLRQGFLILPRTSKVSITDGQHREEAIAQLFDSLPPDDKAELARQAVAVIVTNEMELDQIHQDFADASKAKMLPPSLLRMFDTRNPANRLIPLLERNCPLLRGRVEPASKTAGKNSTKLYTANQISSFLKEFLTGSWQLGDEEFENRAQRLLATDEAFDREMGKAVEYINRVTDAVPVLKKLAELGQDAPLSKVAELRDDPADGGGYVCLSATGLVILGRIGHELFDEHTHDWETYADRLGAVPWAKSASMWVGNVVVPHTVKGRKGEADREGLRILQHSTPISLAAEAVRAQIGLGADITPATTEASTETAESALISA
jgi:DNA sulfur modification protein DndB